MDNYVRGNFISLIGSGATVVVCCLLFVFLKLSNAAPIASSESVKTNFGAPESTTKDNLTETEEVTKSSTCEYNRADIAYVRGLAPTKIDYKVSEEGAPSCIHDKLAQAYAECSKFGQKRADDCVAWKIFGSPDAKAFKGVEQDSWAEFTNHGVSVASVDKVKLRSGYLYIQSDNDNRYKAIANVAASTQACYAGTFTWYASPISLLLDDDIDIDKDLKFTNFPLDPRKGSHQWSVWKASKRAPLLVYDPKHKGVISSAAQLFGDWTFGGKVEASLASDSAALNWDQVQTPPWKNGYEALAILDKNSDGKLNGAELTPLALWFDENRNGISESGEVRALKSEGIITLYYQPNREEKASNSLYADRGFERMVNGKVIVGRSVDWRSDTAATKSELINKHLAAALACPRPTLLGDAEGSRSAEVQAIEHNSSQRSTVSESHGKFKESNLLEDPLSGLWHWTSDVNSIVGTYVHPEGYLGFSDTAGAMVSSADIEGHVYGLFGVNSKAVGFNNIFSLSSLRGTRTIQEDGQIKISFTVRPDELSVLESLANYDPKKQEIRGETKAKVAIGMKPMDITYSWVATRLP